MVWNSAISGYWPGQGLWGLSVCGAGDTWTNVIDIMDVMDVTEPRFICKY